MRVHGGKDAEVARGEGLARDVRLGGEVVVDGLEGVEVVPCGRLDLCEPGLCEVLLLGGRAEGVDGLACGVEEGCGDVCEGREGAVRGLECELWEWPRVSELSRGRE